MHPPSPQTKSRRWLPIVLAALAVLVGVGSIGGYALFKRKQLKAREEQLALDAAELTEGAEEDASQSFRDDAYRFEVVHPGEGWKAAGPESMLELDVDALAGLFRLGTKAEVRMWVNASEWPNDDLKARVEETPGQVGAIEIEEQTVEKIDFHGYPAVRLDVSGVLNGMRLLLVSVSFQRDDYAFTVSAFEASYGESNGEMLRTALGAFRPLPGAIAPRPPLPTPDRNGSGWRLRSHAFESASGLSVRAPAGCAVDGGRVAHRDAAYDEALIYCRDPDRTVYVTPYRATGVTPKILGELKASLVDGLEIDSEVTTAKLAGQPIELRRYRNELDVEVLTGIGRLDDALHAAVRIEYAAPLRERVTPTLDATLATIAAMSDTDAAKLRAELRESEPILRAQEGISFRDGVVLDFETGIRWPLPRTNLWRVRVGAVASSTRPGSRVLLHEPTLDLIATVTVHSASDPDFHDDQRPGDAGKSAGKYSWGDTEPVVTLHDAPGSGIPNRRLVATGLLGGNGYDIGIDWPLAHGERGEALAKALVSSFRVSPPPEASERTSEMHLERRLGFALTLPSDARPAVERSAADRAEVIYTLGTTGHLLGATALSLDEGKIDVLVAKTIKDVTTLMNREENRTAERVPTKLAGRPAERVWFEMGKNRTFNITHFVHQHTLYLVIVGAPADQVDELNTRFSLLPPNHGW